MSKAFIKEDADVDMLDDDLDTAHLAPPLPIGVKNYITRAGFQRLSDELNTLLREKRPEVVEVVAWAASNGDRSENGDYIYGKKRLREIDRRIRFLRQRLNQAEVVDPALQPNKDRVFFGATVHYVNQHDESTTVTIVGVDEIDPLNGKISWMAPVARALLKAQEGDVVKVHTPGGWQTLEVVSIRYPDA